MKIFRDKVVTLSWSSSSISPRIFWSKPLEKHQNFICS